MAGKENFRDNKQRGDDNRHLAKRTGLGRFQPQAKGQGVVDLHKFVELLGVGVGVG